MTWGQRIKQARLDLGLTRQECADEFGMHMRTLENYEADRGEPKYSIRVKIDDYFGIWCDRCEGVS